MKLTTEQRDWIMNKLEVLCDSTLTLGGVFCGMEEALTAHTEPEGQQTGIRGMDKQAILDAWLDKAVMMYGEKGNLMIADAYNILSSILTAQEGEIWPKTVDGTDGSQTYRKPAQEDEPCHSDDYHRGVRYGMKLRADADALTARPVAWKDMPPSSFGVDFGATLESDTEPEDGK